MKGWRWGEFGKGDIGIVKTWIEDEDGEVAVIEDWIDIAAASEAGLGVVTDEGHEVSVDGSVVSDEITTFVDVLEETETLSDRVEDTLDDEEETDTLVEEEELEVDCRLEEWAATESEVGSADIGLVDWADELLLITLLLCLL